MSVTRQIAPALLPTVGRLVRPRRPTPDELAATVAHFPAPPARGGVTVDVIAQNEFAAPSAFVVEGKLWPPLARMTMGSFVVRHPEATFLVDAGLNAQPQRFLRRLPAVSRALLKGKPPSVGLAEALDRRGVRADFAILTHLHWDHCCGLAELPGVPALLSEAEYRFLADTATARAHAVVPETVDDTILEPFALDGPPLETFPASHDVFGDGTVQVVSLPGHTPGHVGVLLALASGRRLLLAGDSVWNTDQVRYARERAPVPACLVDIDRDETYRSVLRLHLLPRTITVLPAHDLAAIEAAFATGPLD